MSLHYTAILACLGTIATGLSLFVKPLHRPTLHQNGIHSGEFLERERFAKSWPSPRSRGSKMSPRQNHELALIHERGKQKVNETEPVWPRTRANELPQFEQPNPVQREGTFSFKGRPRVDQEMLLHEER
jgi:hypothetical protein